MEKLEPIRYENGRPMLLGGLRRYYAYADAVKDIPAQWQQFVSLIPIPGQLGTTTYGAMCGHDANGFEYMSAVEVESFAGLPDNMGRMRIDAQLYAVFLHREHISTIRTIWERILKEWLPSAEYQSADKPPFELYDQRFDPATGLGEVEIWIPITQKE